VPVKTTNKTKQDEKQARCTAKELSVHCALSWRYRLRR